jgi:hypothetical protein
MRVNMKLVMFLGLDCKVGHIKKSDYQKYSDPTSKHSIIHLKYLTRLITGIEKLKRYKSPGIYQILAQFTQAGGNMLYSEIHKFIISVWKKEGLPFQWNDSIIVPIYKRGNKMNCYNY